ncbi:MAG: 50S ribosomal protein L6 [Desulfovibrio sp.]|uniref:50S ribosomal protein L6 n=1 Tax=Desulfovibrio sp. 7SRBS1 TaxID=3378064 RepID=UPI003B3FFD07
MSRIGKRAIEIPSGVEVKIGTEAIEVKGPKGSLATPLHPKISYAVKDNTVEVTQVDDSRTAKQQHGLRRTLLANCIEGVNTGYTKELEIVGVGYKVQVQGKNVVLTVGYSHPVQYPLPQGIEATAEGNKLAIKGIDKQLVGEVAAQIRRVRPPEPFKGKGIKYVGEHIRRKAGKSGGKK